MTFRKAYKSLYDQAEPSPVLISRTLAAARPRRFPMRRAAVLALSCMLILTLGASALAAGNPDFNQWLYRFVPDAALYFRPVNTACEDQGIRMAVEAIYIQGNTAEIALTLTDMEGDRLDDTVDLFDSYRIDTPGGASAGCIPAGWDEETRTAAFLIHYRAEDAIRLDKLTFSATQLLTGKQEQQCKVEAFDPESLREARTAAPYSLRGWSGTNVTDQEVNALGMLVLDAGGTQIVPGVHYLGAAWAQGQLRVQLRYTDIAATDNHGYLWIAAADTRIDPVATLAAWDTNHRDSIEEYVFDVTPDALQSTELFGSFITCDTLLEGSWSVTFPVESQS